MVRSGFALGVSGELVNSLDDLIKRVRLRPGDPVLHGHLGLALMKAGRNDEALNHLLKAHQKLSKEPTISNALALTHSALGNHNEALKYAERAVKMAPKAVELQANRASLLGKAGRSEDAIRAYRRIIKSNPSFTGAQLGLGNVATDTGDTETAIEAFEKVLAVQPTNARAFYGLALTVKGSKRAISREIKEQFEIRLRSLSVAEGDTILIHAALGHIADRTGNYAAAFEHFRQFNDLSLVRKRPAGSIPEDRKLNTFIEAIRPIVKSLKPSRFGAAESRGATPVFIVGMPRSGTTLIEQILLQDRTVRSVGESLALHRLSSRVPSYPSSLPAVDDELRMELRRTYFSDLADKKIKSGLVLEKLPENFLHIGLIRAILPEARIIWVKRDPRDVCLSCYFHNFTAGHTFCHDLAELARYHRAYETLMEIWLKADMVPTFELSYEDLTREPEKVLQTLCAFLGLEWSNNFLDFHKARRNVATASNLQVRQPLNSSAVGRWERYRAFLEPLFSGLNENR